MHIETLEVFCDLVELRSFLRTAEKHLLSQSAVSQQVAQMELAFKCQLIDRKKRPIELTPAGQLLYKAARDILERYEQFKSELNAFRASSANRLNVAAIYSIGMHSLQGFVKKFMVQFPGANVHVEYLSAEKIYELVLGGEVDIGLVAVPKRDKRLEVYDFEDEPLVLACSPKHPLAEQKQVDIHQIRFERFIGFEKDVPTRGWIDGILQRYNIVVRPVMEFDNIETVKRAVEINLGISILPKPAMLEEIVGGTMKAVEFSNERFVRPTAVIVRKNRPLSKAGQFFLDLLRKKDASGKD